MLHNLILMLIKFPKSDILREDPTRERERVQFPSEFHF